jgi:hypothetical protein
MSVCEDLLKLILIISKINWQLIVSYPWFRWSVVPPMHDDPDDIIIELNLLLFLLLCSHFPATILLDALFCCRLCLRNYDKQQHGIIVSWLQLYKIFQHMGERLELLVIKSLWSHKL